MRLQKFHLCHLSRIPMGRPSTTLACGLPWTPPAIKYDQDKQASDVEQQKHGQWSPLPILFDSVPCHPLCLPKFGAKHLEPNFLLQADRVEILQGISCSIKGLRPGHELRTIAGIDH